LHHCCLADVTKNIGCWIFYYFLSLALSEIILSLTPMTFISFMKCTLNVILWVLEVEIFGYKLCLRRTKTYLRCSCRTLDTQSLLKFYRFLTTYHLRFLSFVLLCVSKVEKIKNRPSETLLPNSVNNVGGTCSVVLDLYRTQRRWKPRTAPSSEPDSKEPS
jgi:hypothetical protein